MPPLDHCVGVLPTLVLLPGRVCRSNGVVAIVVVVYCRPNRDGVCGCARSHQFCIVCGCADANSTVVCVVCCAMPGCVVGVVVFEAIAECGVAKDGW